MREHFPVFEALGFLHPSVEDRIKDLAKLDEVSDRGRERRKALTDGMRAACHEFLAQGSDMGQRYESSAIFRDAGDSPPQLPADAVLYHEPHTYPGCRLPHAWLNTAVPTATQLSTLDLAGKGRFVLFTGHGGDAWRTAAKHVKKTLNLEIAVFFIGYGLEYEAVYGDWYKLREVEEDGCVLVRPDNFVAWRSLKMANNVSDKLVHVMKSILGS